MAMESRNPTIVIVISKPVGLCVFSSIEHLTSAFIPSKTKFSLTEATAKTERVQVPRAEHNKSIGENSVGCS